jgi:hypothetical protein
MPWLVAFFVLVAPAICSAAAPVGGASEIRSGSPTPAAVSSNAPVDRLIPLLLNEDRQLHGIPFSDVIFAATGKQVLAFDPQNEVDQRVIKQISAACDETIKRLNVPASSCNSSFRTFYFEPKKATNKVRDDAVHFIVGFEHERREKNEGWKFMRWDLVDLSHFKVKLKAEFQVSNRDMYGRRQLW